MNDKEYLYIERQKLELSLSDAFALKNDQLHLFDKPIHSKYNPQKEAHQIVSKLALEKGDCILIFGMGMGYILKSLEENIKNRIVIIIESRDFYKKQLPQIETINFPLYLFFTDEIDNMKNIIEESIRPAKIVCYQNQSYKSAYKDISLQINQIIEKYNFKREVNSNTLQKFGKLWTRNFLRNYATICKSPGISICNGIAKGLSVCLVAAGPSLDESLPYLSEIADRVFICAVDTSLRALLNYGIEPDFCVMMDPQYWNSCHIDGLVTRKTIFISDSSISSRALHNKNGRLFIADSIFPIAQFLDPHFGARGQLAAGGSVATSAWDFCRLLGPEKIFVLGLDLSYPGTHTHYRGSYFEAQLHNKSTRTLSAMQGFFDYLYGAGSDLALSPEGKILKTDSRMNLYARWFEAMVPQTSIPSYRITNGARKMEAFKEAQIEDILALDIQRKEINHRLDILLKLGAEFTNTLPETRKIIDFKALLSKIHSSAEKAAKLCEHYDGQLETIKKLDHIDSEIMSNANSRIIGFLLEDMIYDIETMSNPESEEGTIDTSFRLYQRIKTETEYLLKLLEKQS